MNFEVVPRVSSVTGKNSKRRKASKRIRGGIYLRELETRTHSETYKGHATRHAKEGKERELAPL